MNTAVALKHSAGCHQALRVIKYCNVALCVASQFAFGNCRELLLRRGLLFYRHDRRRTQCIFRFLRQPQRAQAIHVLADVNGLFLDLNHRLFAFNPGDALFFEAGELFGRL